MERTRQIHIDNELKALNEALGTPVEPSTRIDGNYRANIGNIHMESTGNGGYRIVRMTTTSGCTSNIGHDYRMSKNQVWMTLRAMNALASMFASKQTEMLTALHNIRDIGYNSESHRCTSDMLAVLRVAEGCIFSVESKPLV